MNKNTFLMINDIIYDLYLCTSIDDLKHNFLTRLRFLVPCSYATILLPDPQNATGNFYPVYTPDTFGVAEERYLASIHEDKLLWNCYSREPNLMRESDLLPDDVRLTSKLYTECYKGFDIYDSLQYTSAKNHTFLGVLTLFRTRTDGPFTEEEMFLINSLGLHFNTVLYRIVYEQVHATKPQTDVNFFCTHFSLTKKESAILSQLLQFRTNEEISDSLSIALNTFQKHMQNIFRKTNTASKWELLHLFHSFL